MSILVSAIGFLAFLSQRRYRGTGSRRGAAGEPRSLWSVQPAMEALLAEFTPQTVLPWQVIAVRLLLSVVIGGILGFEREMMDRPAGMRTHMLVCLASATFAIVAVEIVSMPVFDDRSVQADPVRLVEAITAGVAFLAAGFIIFKRGHVRGLTTGAGMWLAAAAGLAAGLGLWIVAALTCLLGALVLAALRQLELHLGIKHTDSVEKADE